MDEPEIQDQPISPALAGEVVPWEPQVGDRVRLKAEERVSYGRATGAIDWMTGEVEMTATPVTVAVLPAGATGAIVGIRDIRAHQEGTPQHPWAPVKVQRFYQLSLDDRPSSIPATQPLLFRKENLELTR